MTKDVTLQNLQSAISPRLSVLCLYATWREVCYPRHTNTATLRLTLVALGAWRSTLHTCLFPVTVYADADILLSVAVAAISAFSYRALQHRTAHGRARGTSSQLRSGAEISGRYFRLRRRACRAGCCPRTSSSVQIEAGTDKRSVRLIYGRRGT